MKYVRVLYDHVSDFPNPLKLQRGARVKLGQRNDEWPEWFWCEDEAGSTGWIPGQFITRQDQIGKLNRDYDATELNVKAGERLRVLEEVGGWYWCEIRGGQRGWIPANKTKE